MTDITDSINAALAATDTAARALWEAMGSPGEYHFGKAVHGYYHEVTAFFNVDGLRATIDLTSGGEAAVSVRRGELGCLPEFEHHGTLDSCRAALAAYLGAS